MGFCCIQKRHPPCNLHLPTQILRWCHPPLGHPLLQSNDPMPGQYGMELSGNLEPYPPFPKKKTPSGSSISEPPKKKNVFPRFVYPGSSPENLPTPTTSHTRAVLDWLKPHSIFAEQKTEIKWNQSTPQWKSVKWLQYETMPLDYFSSWHPKDQQNTTPLWPSRSLHPSPHSRVILETKSANIPGTYWNVGSWEIVVNQVGKWFALRFFSKTTKNSCDF